MKQIVVTDVTRFKKGNPNYCIAGIDIVTGECIRPIDYLSIEDVNKLGIMPGSILCANFDKKQGINPHVEDSSYNHIENKCIDMKNFFLALENSCVDNITSIFGTLIGDYHKKIALFNPPNCSIITLKVKSRQLNIIKDNFNKLRVNLTDNDGTSLLYLPLTDLNTFNKINYSELGQVNQEFENFDNLYLRIGLSREYQGFYWIQVNGIYGVPSEKN